MTQPESFKCPTCKSHLEFQQGDGAGMGRSQYYLLKFVNKVRFKRIDHSWWWWGKKRVWEIEPLMDCRYFFCYCSMIFFFQGRRERRGGGEREGKDLLLYFTKWEKWLEKMILDFMFSIHFIFSSFFFFFLSFQDNKFLKFSRKRCEVHWENWKLSFFFLETSI